MSCNSIKIYQDKELRNRVILRKKKKTETVINCLQMLAIVDKDCKSVIIHIFKEQMSAILKDVKESVAIMTQQILYINKVTVVIKTNQMKMLTKWSRNLE